MVKNVMNNLIGIPLLIAKAGIGYGMFQIYTNIGYSIDYSLLVGALSFLILTLLTINFNGMIISVICLNILFCGGTFVVDQFPSPNVVENFIYSSPQFYFSY